MAAEQADGSNYRDDSKTIAEDADGSNYRDDSETIDEDADGSNYRDDDQGISEVADGSDYRREPTSRAGGGEADTGKSDAKLPTKREVQAPIGAPSSDGGTWLSSEGKHDDESLREEAADRARRAVEPGRPRE